MKGPTSGHSLSDDQISTGARYRTPQEFQDRTRDTMTDVNRYRHRSAILLTPNRPDFHEFSP